MAEYILVDDAQWESVKASQNGDGTATFWANSFLPMFRRICAIADYLRADGTIPIAGATLHGTASGSGAAVVGMPATAVNGWAGGTLFAFLEAFGTSIVASDAAKVAKTGDIINGAIVCGANGRVQFRPPAPLPDSATHTMTLGNDFYTAPNISQNTLYTIPNPSASGQWFVARRTVVGSGFNASFARVSGVTIGILPNTGKSALLFVSQGDGLFGFEWSAWPLGGNALVFGS